jgi:hypothetical protein
LRSWRYHAMPPAHCTPSRISHARSRVDCASVIVPCPGEPGLWHPAPSGFGEGATEGRPRGHNRTGSVWLQPIHVYRNRRDGQIYMNQSRYDDLHQDVRSGVEAAAEAAGANDTTVNIVKNSFKGTPRHRPYDDRNPLKFSLRHGVGCNILTGERVIVPLASVNPECLNDIDAARWQIESRNEAIFWAAAQVQAAGEMAAAARAAQASADRARDAVRDLKCGLGL